MHHEIMDVAKATPGVDADELEGLLVDGTYRSEIFDDLELAQGDGVQGSPHFFLPDGTEVHNPGVKMSWEGEHGSGFPVVSKDDPSIFEDLLKRAAT
jgi:predicted DsbA family dithiol-disulfide isomerase